MLSTAPTLRPMNLGDILDTTFSLYRQNFALVAGIVAVLTIPETILNLIVTAVVSLMTQPRPQEELVGLVYSMTPKPVEHHLAWHQRPLTLAGGIVVILVVLNLIFA